MNTTQRREKIVELLSQSTDPVSATALAQKLRVSRQIIVGDVAILRASNMDILSTPRGYLLMRENASKQENCYTIACVHHGPELAQELYIIVDNGGMVLDVTIEHPIYGQLLGQLQLQSRYDVDCFLQSLEKHKATPLCNLTAGVHLHTIRCPSQEVYSRILSKLREQKILFEAP